MQLGLIHAEPADETSSDDDRPGSALEAAIDGPYEIVRRLGEGGMGVVYLAQQTQPIRRLVAVKIARAVLGSRQEIARFESERQALAALQHPGIATIFDAGTTRDGRPFFTLEYVPGVPITAHCDEHQLSIAARLELFRQVCTAVQHAHQKGIIHRDLKPSNVLVMQEDERPVAKVIDFGLAKAVNANLAEYTWVTQRGVFVGTPEYMSPEQAGAPTVSLDTRTDIYSLGVILYELLAGVRPFEAKDLRKAAVAEMFRIVREVEPVPLSTRIRALSGPTAFEIARRRQFNVRALSKELRGELDWITLRCLEKDPARRYASASELSADIFRHLHHEPIAAGPPRLSYRLGKLARKHKAAFVGMAGIVVALMVGLAVSLVLYRRAADLMALSLWRSYVANVVAADLAIQLGSAQEAQRRLDQADQSLRSWEWHHLSLVADSSVSRFETSPVTAETINFDPSGRYIIWSGGDRFTVVDLVSKRSVSRRVPGMLHGRSADGRRGLVWNLAAVFGRRMPAIDKRVTELRNLESDEPIATIGRDPPGYVLFSPDGARVLVALDEQDRPRDGVTRRLRLLDARTGAWLRDIEWPRELEDPPTMGTQPIAFSPDARRLALCAGSHLYVWDMTAVQAPLKKPAPDVARLGWLTYTAGGRKIACIGQSGTYTEWEAETGRVLATRVLPVHGTPAAMTAEGSHIAWRSGERIVIADVLTGAIVMTLLGHTAAVAEVAYSPDGTLLVSAALDGVRVWRAGFDRALSRLQASTVTSLAFHPTRPILIAADGTHGVEYWDLNSSQQVALQSAHKSALVSASFSRDGRTVISGDQHGTIHRWDFGAARPSLTINGDRTGDATLTALAVAPDDLAVFAARQDGRIDIRSGTTGQLMTRLGDGGEAISCLAASTDHLVAGTASGYLLVWRRRTWELVHRVFAHDGGVDAVTLTADGRQVASGGRDSIIRIWEGRRWNSSISLVAHQGPVRALTFDPVGRRLVSGGADARVRVWDAEHGDLLLTLPHDGAVTALAFSPDGSRISSSSTSGRILVWNTATADGTKRQQDGSR